MAGVRPHFLSRFKKSHDGFSRQLAQCEVSTNGAREGAEPRVAPLRATQQPKSAGNGAFQ
jgi:hypothetical protein